MAQTMLPPPVFAAVHRIERRMRSALWQVTHPGRDYSCPFCGKEFGQFIPYVNPYEISVTADIISGQSILTNKCPCCHSYDRERGLYFYFKDHVDFAGKRVLHIAPEDSLHSLVASSGCLEYVCGDLDPRSYYPVSSSVRKIDLLGIEYPDRYFDIVICNHVLEHIPDDIAAMSEIFRVLDASGTAILLVPIGARLEQTYEDASKLSPDERAFAFGKDDHVRIYAEGSYLARLRSVGFRVSAQTLDLSEKDRVRFGINGREKIYVAIKPA
jgi:SAM-dependent methyltransferase